MKEYWQKHPVHAPDGERSRKPLSDFARSNGWTEEPYNPPMTLPEADKKLVEEVARAIGLANHETPASIGATWQTYIPLATALLPLFKREREVSARDSPEARAGR